MRKIVGGDIQKIIEKIFRAFLLRRYRRFPKLLYFILTISVLLNVYGIWWGLPSIRGWAPDEIIPADVQSAIQEKFSHGWHHGTFPPFHFYVLSVSYVPFYILDMLDIIDISSFSIYTILFYVGRFISVLMGIAAVFVVYLCGRELYGKRASLFAASITSLITPFIYYSKITNLDIPYTFWFMLSLLFFIRILKRHRTADYLLFSATAVISICTKDQAYGLYVLMPICFVVSHYLYKRKQNRFAKLHRSLFNKKIVISLLLAVVLFSLLHNLFFNLSGFIGHIKFIVGPASQSYSMYENTITGHANMLWQSLKHVRFSFGWPMFLTCFAGIVSVFIKKRKNYLLFWILIPAISYYFSFISVILYNYVRFFIAICIIFTFFGGRFLSDFLRSNRKFFRSKVFLVSLLFVYTFFYSISVDVLMENDSRYYVETWMEKNVDRKSYIVLVGLIQYLPRMRDFKQKEYIRDPAIQDLKHKEPDYIVVNSDREKFKAQEFYFLLNNGRLGYIPVLKYKYNSKWLLLSHKDIFMDGRRNIHTNMDKISPEIKVFKRVN